MQMIVTTMNIVRQNNIIVDVMMDRQSKSWVRMHRCGHVVLRMRYISKNANSIYTNIRKSNSVKCTIVVFVQLVELLKK